MAIEISDQLEVFGCSTTCFFKNFLCGLYIARRPNTVLFRPQFLGKDNGTREEFCNMINVSYEVVTCLRASRSVVRCSIQASHVLLRFVPRLLNVLRQ